MTAGPLAWLMRGQRAIRTQLSRPAAAWKARVWLQAKLLGRDVAFSADGQVATIREGRRAIRIATRWRPYVWEVLHQFDTFHAAVEPTPIDDLLVVDLSRPAEHRLRPSGVAFEFVSYPESELTGELYLELADLRPGAVVIDGGAYCGASAYAFSRAVGPTGRVLAFEPDPQSYAALQRNLRRHGLDNVTALPQGLWSSSGRLRFVSHGNMGSAIVRGDAPDAGSIEVTSLADAVARAGVDRLDFVKLDIEGAEVEVLAAARDVLRTYRPRVVVEAHLVDGRLTTRALRELLRDAGYRSQILLEIEEATFQLVYGWPDGAPSRPRR